MTHANPTLTLALATTLLASTANAASGDRVSLRVSDDEGRDFASGRAGEIYAEVTIKDPQPGVRTPVGGVIVQLWNRSGTPYVSYDVAIILQCTGSTPPPRKASGTLSSSSSPATLLFECDSGAAYRAVVALERR